MKQSLAIFGDSFAFTSNMDAGPTWVTYLENEFTIQNFSKPGSSIYFSYTKFINQISKVKYDKLIFIVSSVDRLWLGNLFKEHGPYDYLNHIVSASEAIRYQELIQKTFPDNIIAKNKMLAAANYFKYIQNTEEDELATITMLSKIKDLRPDLLLVNAFNQNADITKIVNHENSLTNIVEMENNAMNLSLKDFYGLTDKRPCHITIENNKILGTKMSEWLYNGKVNLLLDDFIKPTNKKEFCKLYLPHLYK